MVVVSVVAVVVVAVAAAAAVAVAAVAAVVVVAVAERARTAKRARAAAVVGAVRRLALALGRQPQQLGEGACASEPVPAAERARAAAAYVRRLVHDLGRCGILLAVVVGLARRETQCAFVRHILVLERSSAARPRGNHVAAARGAAATTAAAMAQRRRRAVVVVVIAADAATGAGVALEHARG